ncbi:MAG TPA: EamA family transporter, partial [Candidatus Limnocylindrales bacterium]|nr:EamA family transporter [Candidatus Limnocylindrales bacterium]
MTDRSSQLDWVIFLLLGFFWGSSYLFIKLAVDDFGTFTLVALRLVVGAILLWLVIRIAGQRLPRERRIYGHLVVMSIINITIPFLLITWAE